MQRLPDPDSAAILQLIAEYSSDVIALVGSDMRFRYISPSAYRLFGRPCEDVVGRYVFDFVYQPDFPILRRATEQVLAGASDATKMTVRVIKADGSLVWIEVASRLIGDPTAAASGDRAVVMRDISERKALEDSLRDMALKDGLTGLANRRAFDQILPDEWERAVHRRADLSLLLIDLDRFKQFNDAYGHQAGDDCLRSVAKTLQAIANGPNQVTARYGGEEIAIIFPGADADTALAAAEKARCAIADLQMPDGLEQGGVVTISIGVATAVVRDASPRKTAQSLLSAADRELYIAKNGGRDRVSHALIIAGP